MGRYNLPTKFFKETRDSVEWKMIELKHPRQIKIIEPFLLFILITAMLIYGINALNSQDLLWFISRSVDARPNRIVVWQNGEQIVIQPGHDDFVELSEAAHQSLHDFNNTNLINIGFGDDTLAYYEDSGVMVELYYDRPVEFHAPFRTGDPTKLLVPVKRPSRWLRLLLPWRARRMVVWCDENGRF